MVLKDGSKMSKSKGNVVNPMETLAQYGSDALRLGLISSRGAGQNQAFSTSKVLAGRNFCNKLWNAARYVLMNTEGQDCGLNGKCGYSLADRWIRSRLQATIREVRAGVESYRFDMAARAVYEFVWNEYCDWYLEIAKPRIYDGDPEISQVLLHTLERTLALAHPVMPFVTEAIWEYHPYRDGHMVVHSFPEADASRISESVESETGAAIALTRQLRGWRDMAGVPPKIVLQARGDASAIPEFVARLGRVDIGAHEGESVATVAGFGILASDELDMGAVTDRIDMGERVAIACALGGPENKTLFLLSSTDAYPERLRGTKLSRVDTLTVEVAGTGPLDREVHHH